MPKFKKYQKRQPSPKLQPRRACYWLGDRDVAGVEFDAKFTGETHYSRLFYVPEKNHLYQWMIDRRPECFVRISVKSISEKRKDSLLAVREGEPAAAEPESA